MFDEEQKFGLDSVEESQGFQKMPMALPVEPTTALDVAEDLGTDDPAYKHLTRTDESEPIDRSYKDVRSGEEIDRKYSVSQEQAASDLARARSEEQAARQQREQADLKFALDQLPQDGQPPRQPAQQDQQPAALDEPQPDAPQMTAEEAQRLSTEADRELETALQNPLLREKLETEFNAVRAESKQEVERAHNLFAAVRDHYVTATNNLVAEASGIIGALYPELNGLSGAELNGALRVMAQQNPQRVQALQQLASRAQGLVQAQQRQQYEAQQGHAMQQQHELEKFSAAEEKRYEEAVKHVSAETMRAVRKNVYPTVEKAYGIPKETMQRLYSGEQRVDSAVFVRSAAFQLMLTDAVKYRLSKQGITQARANSVQKVMRPGVSESGPSDNNEYASLERQFPGKDLNPKQAADLLIAHRARR